MENKTFTRKELYDLVWSESLLNLSRKFDISDNGLRNICIKMNIPLPQAGHWNKLKAGKSVFIHKLPESYSGEKEITLSFRTDEKTSITSVLNELAEQIKNDPRLALTVPDRLSNPDKLIIEAKKALGERHAYDGIVRSFVGELDIKSSPKNVGRALRFMDTLIKILRQRGHDLVLRGDSTYALVENQELKICFRERLKKVMVKDHNWERTAYQPTGILYFKMDAYYGKEWIDGKIKLEDQIPSIIAKMEVESQRITEMQMENEKRWQEQRDKEREQLEIEEKKGTELFLFKEALAKASRWHKANNLRNYIKAFEQNCNSTNALTEENKLWLSWAKKKADWYDPFIEMEDELLMDVDRNNLAFQPKIR
jgi:hypothetical protein